MSNDILKMSYLSYDGNFDNPDLLSATSLCGHIQAFKYLFNTYQKKKEGETKDQYYLAHSAAASGNLKLLKWIIKNTKCDVTDQDIDGLTILHVGCLTVNMEVVQWVLQCTHLSPVVRTTEGATCLHFAAWSGSIEIAKLMIETEPRLLNMRMINGATAAMFATQGGYTDLMKLLLDEGANFGLPTIDGVNCLHLAAQQGHLDAVKWLVENTGLSLNCKDEHGATPIHYAAIKSQHHVVKWLMEKEVRLLKDRFEDDSQLSDSGYDTIPNVEEMIKSQTHISVTDSCGFTALDLVQERLKRIFSDCESSMTSAEKDEQINGIGQCSISVNVLLLLQSALSDLRSQYQVLLRKSYKAESTLCNDTISHDTQTTESTVDYPLKWTQNEESQTELSLDDISHTSPIPPAPPLPPIGPPIISDVKSNEQTSPLLKKLKERKQRKTSINRRRRSSEDNAIQTSLIQELKEMNTVRSRNMKMSDYETTDTDSVVSNSDTFSFDSSIKSVQSTVRGSVTESAPNIFSLFSNIPSPNQGNDVPKWKADLMSKHAYSNSKENVDQFPQWKREMMGKKKNTPDKIDCDSLTNNIVKSSYVPLPSPKGSKVTELVNKWQSNATS